MEPILLNSLTLVGAGIVRNVAGWLENAMADDVVDPYEWGQLGATILRTAVIGVGAIYGLGMEPFAAAGAAILGDFIFKALKGRGK